ncbi:lipopolysaccharide biosynthesis protein [Rhodoflexus sp.]
MKRFLLFLWNSPTLTTWGSFAARALSVLVLPLALRRLDAAEVSLWNILLFIVSLQTAIDLGFTPTFSRLIAIARGYNDEERIVRLYNTMRGIYAWLGIAAFALLLPAGTYYLRPFIEALNRPQAGWQAWAVVLFASLIYLQGNRYKAFLEGLNHIPALRRWEILTGIGAALTNLAVLLAEGGVLGLIATNQLWVLVGVWRNRWLAHHLGRAYTQQKMPFAKELFTEVWQVAWRSGLGILFAFGTAQISVLLFARTVPAAQSASFTTAVRILQMITDFSLAPFYSKLPRLASLFAAKEIGVLMGVARQGMQRAYWAYLLPWIAAGLVGRQVLEFIGSNVQFPDPLLWALLGMGGLLQRHGAMHLHFFTISNRIVWHIVSSVTGAIFVTVAFLLAPYTGILAQPLATIISCILFYNAYCAYHSYRFWGLQFWHFEQKLFIPPLVIGIAYTLYIAFYA